MCQRVFSLCVGGRTANHRVPDLCVTPLAADTTELHLHGSTTGHPSAPGTRLSVRFAQMQTASTTVKQRHPLIACPAYCEEHPNLAYPFQARQRGGEEARRPMSLPRPGSGGSTGREQQERSMNRSASEKVTGRQKEEQGDHPMTKGRKQHCRAKV